MHYLSTRNNKLKETFLNVLFQGLSKEGGLFMPFSWPSISIKNLRGKNYQEIAHEVISPFIQDDISDDDLRLILDKTYQNFDHEKIAPLINIDKNKYISSSGSLIGALKRTIDNAPTKPRDNARDDLTTVITNIVVIANNTKLLAKYFLFELVFA